MRVIHYSRRDVRPFGWHAEPLCGDWGGMDTDWTDLEAGVTCEGCRGLLRAGARPLPGGEASATTAEE